MRRAGRHGRVHRIVVLRQRRIGIEVGRGFRTVQQGSAVHVAPARRVARVDWRGERAQTACLLGLGGRVFCGGRCEAVWGGEPLRRVAAERRACDVGRALRAFAATSDERAQRGFAQKVPSHAALVRSIELDRCAGRASMRRNARATCRNHRVPSPRSGLFVGVFLSLSLGGSRCIAASACVTSRQATSRAPYYRYGRCALRSRRLDHSGWRPRCRVSGRRSFPSPHQRVATAVPGSPYRRTDRCKAP